MLNWHGGRRGAARPSGEQPPYPNIAEIKEPRPLVGRPLQWQTAHQGRTMRPLGWPIDPSEFRPGRETPSRG